MRSAISQRQTLNKEGPGSTTRAVERSVEPDRIWILLTQSQQQNVRRVLIQVGSYLAQTPPGEKRDERVTHS
jgi:hypothetical protein